MPRSVDPLTLTILGKDRHATNAVLEIDVPGTGTISLSDSILYGNRPIVRDWGAIAPRMERADTFPEVRSFVVTLSNVAIDGSRIADVLDIPDIEGARCRLFLKAAGGRISSTQPLFAGFFQAVLSVSQHEVRIQVDDRQAYVARELRHLVGDDYPEAPAAYASRLQPMVYGRHQQLPIIPVRVGQIAGLASAILEADTSLVLDVDTSSWPDSGTIQIGGSELASYSGKDDTTRELTGLSRALYGSTGSDHAAGDVVIERPLEYQFLLADPTFGQCSDGSPFTGVYAVYIAGKRLARSQWSFNAATNILTIRPVNTRAGMRGYNRQQGVAAGLFSHGISPLNPTAQSQGQAIPRKYAGTFQARQLLNPSHGHICAWKAPADTHYWPQRTYFAGVWGALSLAADDDNCKGMSTVKLLPNTPKSWSADYFETYLPPEDLFIRTGFSVHVGLVPRLRRVLVTNNLGVATNGLFDAKVWQQGLKAVKCTVNGVTIVQPIDPGGAFGAPQFTANDNSDGAGASLPEELLTFDFGDRVDPSDAPFDVTLEAVCATGVGDGAHVCRVNSLVQSIDGVLPMSGITDVIEGVDTRRAANLPDAQAQSITLNFDGAPSHAILELSVACSGDYLKIDMGPGKIVRLSPWDLGGGEHRGIATSSNLDDRTNPQAGRYGTVSILVENPASVVRLSACDFGLDGSVAPDDTGGGSGAQARARPRVNLGAATMYGLASGGLTYPLLPPVRAESAFLLAFDEYPVVDATGYVSETWRHGTVGEVIERPQYVIRHFLTQVMGEASADIDEDSFFDASFPSYYTLTGLVQDAGADPRTILLLMCRDARSAIGQDQLTGKWRLTVRKSVAEALAADATCVLDPSSWFAAAPELTRTPDLDLVDVVTVRFNRDWRLPRDVNSYAANEKAGTGTRSRDDRYLCDFVRNREQAVDLAAFYLGWDSVALRRVTLAVRSSFLDVTKEDVATVTYPVAGSRPTSYVGGLNAKRFLVEATGFALGRLPSTPDAVLMDLVEVPDS